MYQGSVEGAGVLLEELDGLGRRVGPLDDGGDSWLGILENSLDLAGSRVVLGNVEVEGVPTEIALGRVVACLVLRG